MENDQNRTNLTIIIVLIAIIFLIAILSMSNNRKDEKRDTSNEAGSEEIKKDTSVDQGTNLYKSYEIGDQVVLLDSSSWHVIKKSNQKEETITLLKDTKITTELKQEEANNFLVTNYIKLLKDNLSALSTDIKEIRLITLEDIKEIIGVDILEFETPLEKENITWLTTGETLTSDISSDNFPLLICTTTETEEHTGKICEGKEQQIWPVRPVIKISKEYIKD